MSCAGSGRVKWERSNVTKNSVAMSASAVVGGVTLMALKTLRRGSVAKTRCGLEPNLLREGRTVLKIRKY